MKTPSTPSTESTPSSVAKDTVVYYHGNCPDGSVAAWACRKKLGDRATYIPVEYSTIPDPNDYQGKHVVIVDFSFPRTIMQVFNEEAREITLLDHHETGQNNLKDFACRCGTIHFDTQASGAELAWKHMHPETPMPEIVRHVSLADRWVWSDPDTRAFVTRLHTQPLTWDYMDKVGALSASEVQTFLHEGRQLLEQYNSIVQSFVKMALPIQFDEYNAMHVSASRAISSDVGDQILKAHPDVHVAIIWAVEKEALKLSFRSRPDINVRELAERLGGGGHPQASAVRIPLHHIAMFKDDFFQSYHYQNQLAARTLAV
jgi:oligoribonuclease NrnB/cAMP/cGMP phosphodiesterase (DHH superfamily)